MTFISAYYTDRCLLGNATIVERHDTPKLPTINIPSFSGNHDEWLAFKNSFEDLIDSRVDISDMVKFAHLKNALKDEALVKVSIFSLSAENYQIAWRTLNEAYNRRRLLAAKHLDAFIDLPTVTKATATNLTKLMDETKQHLHMLDQLKVNVGEDLIVRFLSKRLPVATRKKWEENLDLDKLPTLAELHRFIENNIFKLRALEQEFPTNTENRNRPAEKSQPFSNIKRSNANNARTLVTVINIDCAKCRQKHNLYACPEFNNLQERWDFVKAKQICRNCLRPHPQPCKNNGRCKKCQREHHTILHTERGPRKYQKKDSETTDQISNSKVESTPTHYIMTRLLFLIFYQLFTSHSTNAHYSYTHSRKEGFHNDTNAVGHLFHS